MSQGQNGSIKEIEATGDLIIVTSKIMNSVAIYDINFTASL